jgi:hypothetical protein
MRQTISGLVALIAVMIAGAAPAKACGFGGCCGQAYYSPCAHEYVAPYGYAYSGCNAGCGGWVYERLSDPVTQYYWVNQGPTYTGPGAFAPYPTYSEGAVYGWHRYHHRRYHHGYYHH